MCGRWGGPAATYEPEWSAAPRATTARMRSRCIGNADDVIEFLKVELAAVTVGFLVTIWVTRELRGA